jgi:hypothetical protein
VGGQRRVSHLLTLRVVEGDAAEDITDQESVMRHPFAFALLALLLAAACSVPSGHQDEVFERERDVAESAETPRAADDAFFLVTRPDYRKCMWPLCGGVFVAQANQAQTVCSLEGSAADCYVAEIDWSAVGLAPTELGEINAQAAQGHVLVRGALELRTYQAGELSVLVATGAWHGVTLNAPTADLYYVVDNGITCITFPCPSLTELRLNTSDTQKVAGLDLATSGAAQPQIEAAQSELAMDGLMVSANHQTVTGPAGEGQALVAVEFYARLGNAPAEPCGGNLCAPTEFCCNPSCGICAPHGGACIEIACAPECGHDECVSGQALTAICSPCADQVCATDPYCCDTAWDQVCVYRAQTDCSNLSCSASAGTCTHPLCTEGAPLFAGCDDPPISPSCTNAICAADPACCSTAWDATCVEKVDSVCGYT